MSDWNARGGFASRAVLAASAVVVLAALVVPASVHAWNFGDKSCVTKRENTFKKSQPQVYLMLDRSGSMSGSTDLQTCPTCNYSYRRGQKISTRTVHFNRDGDRERVSWNFGSSGGSPATITKQITTDGDNLSFRFTGLRTDASSQVPVTVEMWGDLDWSSEYAWVYGDGDYLGRQCRYGCDQCSNSPETRTFYVPMSDLSDGQLDIDVNFTGSVNDFCSPEKVRVSIPERYARSSGFGSSTSSTQTKNYSRTGEDVDFTFTNMQKSSGSTFPVSIQLWGDYNARSEYVDVYVDGAYQGTRCRYNCDQCSNQPHTQTFNIPQSYLSDGRLNVEVRNSSSVHKLGCEAKIRVAIPEENFNTSGSGTQACYGVQFDIWGDYNSSSEYADLELDYNRVGRLCDGRGCDQCGGPHTAVYEPSSAAMADGHLSATVDNSYNVDTFCSTNKAEMSLVDHSKGATASGSYTCLSCAVEADCRSELPVADCAVDSVSLTQSSCSATASKWSVAEGSLKSIVGDMTTADPDAAEFGLGLFNSSAWNEVAPRENASSAITSALNSNSPGGGTDMEDAIDKASSQLSQSGGSSRLQASVVITDGIHGGDDTDVIRAACNHRDNTGKLFVVGFASGTDPAFNDAVAAAGGTGTCCKPGHNGCSPSGSDVADICSWSDAKIDRYSDGRQLDCTGAKQASNGVALKSAISGIASDLSCTVDVSNLGSKKWADSYYDCAPEYDCFKITLPGINKRIYHVNSSNSPKGWKWSNPSRQENIVLTSSYCQQVKTLTDNRVVTRRACMCDKPKRGSCPVQSPSICQCKRGRWSCGQGFDSCSQLSHAQCPPGLLKGAGGRCTSGQGVCQRTGSYRCPAPGRRVCSATPKRSKKGPEVCDGKDNDCDGKTDEPSDLPAETCNGVDDDCDGKIDEGLGGAACTDGDPKSRCSVGQTRCVSPAEASQSDRRVVSSGGRGYKYICAQSLHAMPEVCNGLDDDCDGNVDDLADGWETSGLDTSIPQMPPAKAREGDAICPETRQCICTTPQSTHRGSGAGYTTGDPVLDEFKDYIDAWSQHQKGVCYCAGG